VFVFFRGVLFPDESTNSKPRNHTNQESRKDTKVGLMSQVLLPVFLLPFLIPPVETIHLCGDLPKTFTYLIAERPNLRLQLLPKKQPHGSQLVVRECHARFFITLFDRGAIEYGQKDDKRPHLLSTRQRIQN